MIGHTHIDCKKMYTQQLPIKNIFNATLTTLRIHWTELSARSTKTQTQIIIMTGCGVAVKVSNAARKRNKLMC